MTKYYTLKKDLPTFKAGEKFYISAKGSLISVENEPLVAYSRQTLEKFPDILEDWFEEISEVYKRWRAEKRGYYYYYVGWVEGDIDGGEGADLARYNTGNYFKTKKEAEKYEEYLIALQTIKDDANGFVPDWEDGDQAKYYGFYNHNDGFLEWNDSFVYQIQGAVYFETKKDIKDSFKKHRKEWMIVLGVEDE